MRQIRLSLLSVAVCAASVVWAQASDSQPAQGPDFQLVDAYPNLSFNSPVDFQHADDGSDIVYVVQQGGVIRSFVNDESTSSTTTFLDIDDRVASGGETGLLGLAFHPDFESNGFFFVDYTTTGTLRTRISRFSLDANNPEVGDPDSEEVLIEINQPFSNHNAGQIAFGPDGYLYVTLGDGGSGDDPQNHGQRPTTLLGSILRLDVDGGGNPLDCGLGTGSATIPPDNPLVDGTGGDCDEIYAYGLRNPWRVSFDPATGELWAADVGQGLWEEVDIITAGGNFGWRPYEGNQCVLGPCDPAGKTFPVWEYDHGGGRCSITGGYVYRGLAIPELQGWYIYGDYCSGQIWAFDTSDPGGTNEQIESFNLFSLASFGTDAAGELFALAEGGKIRKLVRVPPTSGDEAPGTLEASFELRGPNPARSHTTLRFLAPRPGPVTISVFDLLGREVARLYEADVTSLTLRDVRFETARLPAGVYVARLILDGSVLTQKLTVVN